MRARALATTSSLPPSCLGPPLTGSGERECAARPGAPGNVSRPVRTALRVSPALGRRAAPAAGPLVPCGLLHRAEGWCLGTTRPQAVPPGALRPGGERDDPRVMRGPPLSRQTPSMRFREGRS